MSKKALTPEQKKAMEMKYEKVKKMGWKGLTSRESGKIGGLMGKKNRENKKNDNQKES